MAKAHVIDRCMFCNELPCICGKPARPPKAPKKEPGTRARKPPAASVSGTPARIPSDPVKAPEHEPRPRRRPAYLDRKAAPIAPPVTASAPVAATPPEPLSQEGLRSTATPDPAPAPEPDFAAVQAASDQAQFEVALALLQKELGAVKLEILTPQERAARWREKWVK